LKQTLNCIIKVLLCLLFVFCLLTCGIEEFYYLPQVSGGNINTTLSSRADFTLPTIPSEHYYAIGYRIYYKIYLSGVDGGGRESPGFNSTFVTDYNYFENTYNNPSNTTSSVPTISTFSGRRFYELEHLSTASGDIINIDRIGGTVSILFPLAAREIPTITINNTETQIIRSSSVTSMLPLSPINSPNPEHEVFFRNTSGLNNNSNATTSINADTASGQEGYAYAAMYIVTVGKNPQNFSFIFSKPTFISVFRLPDMF